MTALGAGLQRLCAEYKWEKNEAEPYSAQHRWQVLKCRLELYVQRELGAAYAVRSSMGCGGWAKVPWLAVSDTSESTQHGLYLQYLIRADCTAVHFCLGQGTTKLKKLFGGAAASRHLRHVGEYVRKRCRTLLGDDSPFDLEGEISLGAGSNSLADGYEKASIVSRTYTIGALPDEATLLAELRQLLAAYAAVLSDAEYIDGIKKPVDQQIADAERQKREAEAAAKNDSRLVVAAAPAAPAADGHAGFAAPAADGQAGFAAPPDTTPSKEVDAFGAAIPAPLSLTWNAALNLAFDPPDLGGWKGAKPRGGGGGAKRKRGRGAAGDASSGDEPLGDDDEKVGSGFDSMSEDERRGGGDDSDEVEELDEEATAAALQAAPPAGACRLPSSARAPRRRRQREPAGAAVECGGAHGRKLGMCVKLRLLYWRTWSTQSLGELVVRQRRLTRALRHDAQRAGRTARLQARLDDLVAELAVACEQVIEEAGVEGVARAGRVDALDVVVPPNGPLLLAAPGHHAASANLHHHEQIR